MAVETTQNPFEKSWRRSFWPLIVTRFQGAFSDNAYKEGRAVRVLKAGLAGRCVLNRQGDHAGTNNAHGK